MRLVEGWLARRWVTIAVFAVLAPVLFMLLDMAFEQALQPSGLSAARMWAWIAEDGFLLPRAVYAFGIVPALAAGMLVARRDAKRGASALFAAELSAGIGLLVGTALARNLFLFAPPPLLEQLAITARAMLSVVATGLICYAVTRMARQPAPQEGR